MNLDEHFAKLAAAGWFDGWTDFAQRSARKTIQENISAGAGLAELSAEYPGVAMISIWGDSECVDADDAYSDIVKNFARGSHGLFDPTNIKENWIEAGDSYSGIDVSFEFRGEQFEGRIPYENSDWMEFAIVELMNKALAKLDPPLVFAFPSIGGGQEYAASVMPARLCDSDQGLLPAEESYLDDEEEFDHAGDDEEPEFPLLAALEEDPFVLELTFGDVPDHLICLIRRDLGGFKSLVAAGADVNARSEEGGLAPLLITILENFPEGFNYLLTHADIDLNVRDDEGDAAINWAIENGRAEFVRSLAEAGANLQTINDKGENLLQCATKYDRPDIAACLREY